MTQPEHMLSLDDVTAILNATADERILRPCRAWLRAYRLAKRLAFDESHARSQAGAAWDRAAAEMAAELLIAEASAN